MIGSSLLVLALASIPSQAQPHSSQPQLPHAKPAQPKPVQAAPAPPSVASDATPAPDVPAPDVPAYGGTLAQGLAEMQRLSDAKKNDEALRIGDELLAPNGFLRWKARATAEAGWPKTLIGLADPLLDRLGANGAEPPQRAAVHYAKGVVHARAGAAAEAQAEFESARSLAGPGELRLDAIYDLGTIDLMVGEAHRAEIPEINGGKPAATPAKPSAPPGVAGAPGAPGATGAQTPPDPLALAEQAYLRAREHYVERLRADWHDADARGNTELVVRRLKELSEIKKKREQEKKDQQDQQKQDDKDKKDQQKKDDKQDKDSQDSKDKQDKDKNDSKDPQGQDQKKPEDKKPDDSQKKSEDEKKPDDPKDQESKQPGEEKEQLLTKEEVMRLLDRLNQIEEKGREMQMQLRHARRPKVKKDW